MKAHYALVLAVVAVALFAVGVSGQGFRTVGVRLAFSWGEIPIMFGVEASMAFGASIASATLFLSPGGKTLLLASYDLPLAPEGQAYVRATTGFYYYDRSRLLPTAVVGAGLAIHPFSVDPIDIGLSGEFIYPIAFPMPLFSLGLGWMI